MKEQDEGLNQFLGETGMKQISEEVKQVLERDEGVIWYTDKSLKVPRNEFIRLPTPKSLILPNECNINLSQSISMYSRAQSPPPLPL